MASSLTPPSSGANDRKEFYPNLQNLQLPVDSTGKSIYPPAAAESQTRIWKCLYWLRGQVQALMDCCDKSGVSVTSGGRVSTPQPGLIEQPFSPDGGGGGGGAPPGGGIHVPTGAITTTFQGQVVILSPFPFLQNKISGRYQLNLYNFLNSVPGAWEYGCIQSPGVYIWPWVDTLPLNIFGIPYVRPNWYPGIQVGNKFIHRDDVCPNQQDFLHDGAIVEGERVRTPQGSGPFPPGSITTTFQGVPVLLSPWPFLHNAISGRYQLNLYNFLQSVPGSWEFGCLQGASNDPNSYIWPWVDTLPINGFGIPYVRPEWQPGIQVGNRFIHRDDVCPPDGFLH